MSGLDFTDKKILVVDDQRPFQLMLKGILINLGARQVILVSSGEGAMKACREHTFDFFFIDYNLGVSRKNGRQLLEEIKSRNLQKPTSVFVIVTGESHRPLVLGALEMQPDDYVMKPFSQNVLRTRLEKTFQKKFALRGVYAAMMERDYEAAIKECRKIIKVGSRYRNFCNNILAELFIITKRYDHAEVLLNKLLEKKRYTWGVLALANCKYHQSKYEAAIRLINEIIVNSPLLIDAHDILAKSLYKLSKKTQALEAVIRATDLSPHSIERQYMLCDIARDAGHFDIVKDACFSILNLSRKSIHQDSIHLMNYIRSIIEAAENCDDKKELNKLNQEASLALQRGRHDESVDVKAIGYDTFEKLCNARIEAHDGQMYQAKKHLYQTAMAYQGDFNNLPPELMGDAFSVMLDIGEFDQAGELKEVMDKAPSDNPFLKASLAFAEHKSQDKRKSFNDFNQKGINAYKAAEYKRAVGAFTSALEFAPMHTGGLLNQIQACLKFIDGVNQLPDAEVEIIKGSLRSLDGVPLPEAHQQRLDELKQQFEIVVPSQVRA